MAAPRLPPAFIFCTPEATPGLSSMGVGRIGPVLQSTPNRRQCFTLEPTAEVASSRRNSPS